MNSDRLIPRKRDGKKERKREREREKNREKERGGENEKESSSHGEFLNGWKKGSARSL